MSDMTLAILGSAGQLGRDLAARAPAGTILLTRSDIDLSRPETIRPALEGHRPTVLVNCAAYNFVDKAEAEPDAAFAINAWGVRALAQACGTLGIRLVHFSTDYVFGLDEGNGTPWPESAAPGPVSAYGISKLAGEYAVRTFAPQHLVIRTCGLYGAWGSGGKGTNFIETMLRLAGQGKSLRVVNDQHCTPTSASDLADATLKLIELGTNGLVHATNAGATTWHDLAKEVFRSNGIAADLTPIISAEFGAPAKRPPYSVLSIARLNSLGIDMPHWTDAVAKYLNERTPRLESSKSAPHYSGTSPPHPSKPAVSPSSPRVGEVGERSEPGGG